MGLIGAARALSHPTRLLILNDLLGDWERVSAKSVSLLRPGLSIGHADFHLKELRQAGVIRKHPERMHLTDGRRPEWGYSFDGPSAGRVRDAMDLFAGRKGIAGAEGSEPITFPLGDAELLLLARLLTHPVRVRTILALRGTKGGLLSPAEFARHLDKKVGDVAYPFATLRKNGILEIKGTRQRRGAIEHLHALGGRRAPAALALLAALAGQLEVVEIQTSGQSDSPTALAA